MSIISLAAILQPAFIQRYGVPAFNIINDVSMDAVLAASSSMKAPVIIQTSVKTVHFFGIPVLQSMFQGMVKKYGATATLHLDHCADVALIRHCLEAGWNSALFDTSHICYKESYMQTRQLVEFARTLDGHIEGELEPIAGIEETQDITSERTRYSVEQCVEFIQETGVVCFAPDIGTAHGIYKEDPRIDFDRIEALTSMKACPLVLHGGTGVKPNLLHRLVASGMAKINISTMVKTTYTNGVRTYLQNKPDNYEPLPLMQSVHADLQEMVAGYIRMLGCEGKA